METKFRAFALDFSIDKSIFAENLRGHEKENL